MEFNVKGRLSYLSHILYTKPEGFFIEVTGLCKCVKTADEQFCRFTKDPVHIIWFRNPKLFKFHQALLINNCYEFKTLKSDDLFKAGPLSREILIDTSRTTIAHMKTISFDVNLTHSGVNYMPNFSIEEVIKYDNDGVHGIYELQNGMQLCTSYLQELSNIPQVKVDDNVNIFGVHRLTIDNKIWLVACSRSLLKGPKSFKGENNPKSALIHLVLSYNLNIYSLSVLYGLMKKLRLALVPSYTTCICRFQKKTPCLLQLLGPVLFEKFETPSYSTLSHAFLKTPHNCWATVQLNNIIEVVNTVSDLKSVSCGSWNKHLGWSYRIKLLDSSVVGAIIMDFNYGTICLSDQQEQISVLLLMPVNTSVIQTAYCKCTLKSVWNKIIIVKDCYLVEEEYSNLSLRYLMVNENDITTVSGGHDTMCSSCNPTLHIPINKTIDSMENSSYFYSILLLEKTSLLEKKIDLDESARIFLLHVKILKEVDSRGKERDISGNAILEVSGAGLQQYYELQTLTSYDILRLDKDIWSFIRNKEKPFYARKTMPDTPYIVLPDCVSFLETAEANIPSSISEAILSVDEACREANDEIFTVQGLIVQRRHKRSSLSRFTGHSICVLLQDLQSWETIWIYVTSESVKRCPILGLVPSSVVVITSVIKFVSQQGNGYLSSTVMTNITVTGIRLLGTGEMTNYVPVPSLNDIIGKPSWNNKLITFVGEITSIIKICLVATCANCQRGVLSGYCSYTGCFDGSKVDYELKLSFYISCETTRVRSFAKNFVVRQILRLSATEWKELTYLAKDKGEIEYLNIISQGTKKTTEGNKKFNHICNNRDICRPVKLFCRVYYDKGFTTMYCTQVEEI